MSAFKEAGKAFLVTMPKILASVALLAIIILAAYFIIKKGGNPLIRIRRAYGRINNPIKTDDGIEADRLGSAIDELFREP